MFVVIISRLQNFRRAGMFHPRSRSVYQADQFTDEQLEILKADPFLDVELVEEHPGDPSAGDSQTAQASQGSETPGTVDEHSLDDLVSHIAQLNFDNPDLFKADKSPKASAYPAGTTADQRDEAWAEYQRRKAEAEQE